MNKKINSSIFRFVTMVFMYVFFKIFEKIMSKKIVPRVSRFVIMFLLNISKGYKQKNCPRYFQTRNYACEIFEKGITKQTVLRILRFVIMFFLNIAKGYEQKRSYRKCFQIRKYPFFKYLKRV